MNFAVLGTVFGLIFLAELRTRPPSPAWCSAPATGRCTCSSGAAAAAFVVHVSLAVALGSLLTLLPHRLLQAVVGALFLLGAVLLLRHGQARRGGTRTSPSPKVSARRSSGSRAPASW